jgi:hypothetical protein
LIESEGILSTYINANYVHGAAGEPRRYIAAMGPLPDSVVRPSLAHRPPCINCFVSMPCTAPAPALPSTCTALHLHSTAQYCTAPALPSTCTAQHCTAPAHAVYSGPSTVSTTSYLTSVRHAITRMRVRFGQIWPAVASHEHIAICSRVVRVSIHDSPVCFTCGQPRAALLSALVLAVV